MLGKVALLFCAAIACASALNATAGTYNEQTSHRHTLYSFAAYCPGSKVQPWKCLYCQDDAAAFNVTGYYYDFLSDTVAYVGINPKYNEIVAVFRGTIPWSITNWLEDFSFLKADKPFAGIPGAYVHSGFWFTYSKHRDQVVAEIKRLHEAYPTFDVYVTGHSLGAAQAHLCALDLLANQVVPSVKTYNFGSPRVGNAAFADAFNQRVTESWRVVHLHDVVPHVPLMLMDFKHPATEVWYQADNSYRICDASGEDKTCSNSSLDIFLVPDHAYYVGVTWLPCL